MGDFKIHKGQLVISINNNLNPYSFLITLTHELAHAFVYRNYKNTRDPHGKKWQLMFNVTTQANVATADNFSVYILTTLNNSDYSERSAVQIGQTSEGASGFRNAQCINLFDVTNVSNCKCKFGVNDIPGSNTQIDGDSGKNYTYMTFMRIGDT